MPDEVSKNGVNVNVDSDRDAAVNVNSFNSQIEINSRRKTSEILDDLNKNRKILEKEKQDLVAAINKDGGLQSKASANQLALRRRVQIRQSAIAAADTTLIHRAEDHPPNEHDRETIPEIYARLNPSCFLVSTLYGWNSPEVQRAKSVCRLRFALNPIVAPSWLLYRFLGYHLALISERHPKIAHISNILIALPIIRASDKSIISALPWIAYLGIWGWATITSIVVIVLYLWTLIR